MASSGGQRCRRIPGASNGINTLSEGAESLFSKLLGEKEVDLASLSFLNHCMNVELPKSTGMCCNSLLAPGWREMDLKNMKAVNKNSKNTER